MNPLDAFPERFPLAPRSCPNTAKPRGTPDTVKEQPEIFKRLHFISHFTPLKCFTKMYFSGIISACKTPLSLDRRNKETAKRLPNAVGF